MQTVLTIIPELFRYLGVVGSSHNTNLHFPPQGLQKLIQLLVDFLQMIGKYLYGSKGYDTATNHRDPRGWDHATDVTSNTVEGDTLCNIKTHVPICKRGKRWKQTFPDVNADRMHTTACHVRTCYYAMSRNSNSRQCVGRQQRKAASITEHSHLSGWCQGPVHVKQTEGIPVRREAVQFFHISILFVCLFVCLIVFL